MSLKFKNTAGRLIYIIDVIYEDLKAQFLGKVTQDAAKQEPSLN